MVRLKKWFKSPAICKLIGGIIAVVFAEIYLWCWVNHVDPMPEFLYLDFYTQFRNSLLLTLNAEDLGINLCSHPSVLIDSMSLNKYPTGFLLISWLISCIGLQSLFLSQPYHLIHGLIISIMFLPFLMTWSFKRTIFYYIIFFFFPLTQIILKGLNIEAAIIVASLIALLTYISHLQSASKLKLCFFIFCAWLAMILKHLGVFYFVLMFLGLFIWKSLRNESLKTELILCLILILLVLPFYPLESLQYFSWVINAHSTVISSEIFWFLAALGLMGVFFIILFLRSKQSNKALPVCKIMPTILIASFLLTQLIPLFSLDQENSLTVAIIIVCKGFLALFLLIFTYNLRTKYGLFLIISVLMFSCSTALYFAHIAKTVYVLFLPILLLLVVVIESTQSTIGASLICLFCIVYSNFFPSEKSLDMNLTKLRSFAEVIHDKFEQNGNLLAYLGTEFREISEYIVHELEYDVYERVFNSIDINPLSWNPSYQQKFRIAVVDILESYEFDRSIYETSQQIVFSPELRLRKIFYFPNFEYLFPELDQDLYSYSESMELNQVFLKKLKKLSRDELLRGDFFRLEFKKWAEKGIMPILLLRKTNSQTLQSIIEDFEDEDEDEDEESMWEKVLEIYALFMQKDISLNNFYNIHELRYNGKNLNFQNGQHQIMVHKSIRPHKGKHLSKNYYLFAVLDELKEQLKNVN